VEDFLDVVEVFEHVQKFLHALGVVAGQLNGQVRVAW
jgi:hypothetical protein